MRGIGAKAAWIGAIMAITGVAHADRVSADRCAAALPAISKTMFDAALPAVLRGTAVPDALRAAARPLVMNGSITRDAARPAAEAAGACLAQLR